MKKYILALTFVLVLAGVGYFVLTREDLNTYQSRGVILYAPSDVIDDHLALLDSKDYTIKLDAAFKELDGWMILEYEEALKLAQIGVLNERTSNQEPQPVFDIKEKAPLYWADAKDIETSFDFQDAVYNGNRFLGQDRALVNGYIILNHSEFVKIQEQNYRLVVLDFKINPELIFQSFEDIDSQLFDFNVK